MSEFLEEEIRSFLWDDHPGKYVNKHGVEISIHEDSSVNAACTIWKEKNESIEYGFNCQTLYRFIRVLGINEVGDIDSVKCETLEKLYEEGEGSLFCVLNKRFLEFIKSDEGLIATDYSGRVHIIKTKLHTVSELVEYTLNYYRKFT